MSTVGEQENINIYKIQTMKKLGLNMLLLSKIQMKPQSKNKKLTNNIKMNITSKQVKLKIILKEETLLRKNKEMMDFKMFKLEFLQYLLFLDV